MPNWNTGQPTALFALSHPAAGLAPGTLLIGGSAGGALGATRFFCAWDGLTLKPLGPTDPSGFSANAVINAITTWDSDGPGPAEPLVIVAGSFTTIGGVSANHVAAWDGVNWLPLGAGRPTAINAVTSFDPDGEGAATPLLIAGDAAWDGASWHTLGAGLNGPVYALAAHHGDGVSPLGHDLYAGGGFSASGGTSVSSVARWTGSAWVAAGPGSPGSTVNDLAWVDFDGAGPMQPVLFAARSENFYPPSPLAVLDEGAWKVVTGFNPLDSTDPVIGLALATFDPDGDGPRSAEVIVGATGSWTHLGATPYAGPYAWNGRRWSILGPEIFGGPIFHFAWYDDDGDGPHPPALYASGSFTRAGGETADGLARWDGQRWVGLGASGYWGVRYIVKLASYDPDGDGPEPPWLIGIDGRSSSPAPVVRWTGSEWARLDESLSYRGDFETLCVMDDDGPGPHGDRLFVGTHWPGGNVAVYSGPDFQPTNHLTSDCFALFPHDPDGPGPIPPALYQCGNALRRWDGQTWSLAAPGSIYSYSYAFTAISWEGDGARPPQIVCTAPGLNLGGGRYLYPPFAYDGVRWGRLAEDHFSLSMIASALCSYDPDGPTGPIPSQLVFGTYYGRNAFDGNLNTADVLRLTGDRWTQVTPGLYQENVRSFYCAVHALMSVDPDGDGPLPPELWIGGGFSHAGGRPAANFARWRLSGPIPLITQQPQSVCSNQPAILTVAASNPPVVYRWRVFDSTSDTSWRDIADGPVMVAGNQVGIAAGSSTPTLTFQLGQVAGASFTCVVTGACGAAISREASVTAGPCCGSPDFDCDGDVGTDSDIEAFFACLAGTCPPPPCTGSADFNGDGDVGTDADIESFFRMLAGGSC